MKTKRGAASEKRTPKDKRPPTVGFGTTKTPVNAKQKPSQKKSTSEDPNDIQIEKPSGAAGDATPHRVRVPGPASANMSNPEDDLLGPDLELVELPSLSNEEIAELRFERTGLDETIELFADARRDGRLAEVVLANRDLVTERLLYRFTSAILQVENRNTNVDTRKEEATNMRQLRKDLIAYCWSMDYPLKQELQLAEARLLPILQGSNVKKDIRKGCGTKEIEVNAIWIVIFAAVAAWEEKGKENPELVNVDMQKQLTAAAEAFGTVNEVKKLLSPSLKALQTILSSSDPQLQASVVDGLDDETVNHIASLTEQVRLFPTAAYGALARRMSTIVNYILKAKYDYDQPELVPFRFDVPPMERLSRLVNFAKNASQRKRRR